MSSKAPAAPAAPDPKETAAAQASANIDTARAQTAMNRVNQYTPYGSLIYTQGTLSKDELDRRQAVAESEARATGNTEFNPAAWREAAMRSDPGQDRWTATQTLSPAEQAQLDLSNQAIATYGRAANAQLAQAEQALSQRFNPDFSMYGDPNISRDTVERALNARIQPLQDRDRERLQSNLANQGLTFGSEAYRAAMDDFNRGVNDQRLAVTAAGGAEQSRLAGLRQASLAEQLAIRNQPINEAAALLSGSQINSPQWVGVPQTVVAGTNVMDAYAMQQGGQNAAWQGRVATANANAQGQAALGTAAITTAAAIIA